MELKYKVGDEVIYTSPLLGKKDIGIIIRIRGSTVWANWEVSKKEQSCSITNIRHLTKLEKAMK